jgi:putative SOS response-associated peptidase YedK
MCGRFNLRLTTVELQQFFDLFRAPEWRPRYNIAPTQDVVAIRRDDQGRRVGDLLRWGLIPSWADDPAIGSRLINARADGVAAKPSFRAAFKQRRCLIPATGFYEWQAVTPRRKQPWHLHAASDGPLALAGLWERWTPRDGAPPIESCAIVTTEANGFVRRLHDRMPVILDPRDYDVWLNADTPRDALPPLLAPCPNEVLSAEPVSTVVNNVRNEGAQCLTPAESSTGLWGPAGEPGLSRG